MDRFFIVSDVHLDAVTQGVSRFDEAAEALHFVAQEAVKHEAGFVFAGDLCDPDAANVHRCMAEAVSVECMLAREKVPCCWVAGNHDVMEDGRHTSTLSCVEAAGGSVVNTGHVSKFCGFEVGWLPYAAKANTYSPAFEVELWSQAGYAPQIVIGHLNAKHLQPGSESVDMPRGRAMEWPLDELAKHFPGALLIGGHYHRGEQAGRLNIVGAPLRFNFGESTHEPSYLEVQKNGQLKRHKFSRARRVYSVGMETDADVAKHIELAQKGDIVRVLGNKVLAHSDPSRYDALRLGLIKQEVAGVIYKSVEHGDSAPDDLAARPAEDARVTAEDGFEVAERLAREWPSADAAFNEQLVGLVKELGVQSR